jgi:hypothetical protein
MDGCGSHKFSVNQCESHVTSELDPIYLRVDSRDTKKPKFLTDTVAKMLIIRSSSLTPRIEYVLQEGVNIYGIKHTAMKTERAINLKKI